MNTGTSWSEQALRTGPEMPSFPAPLLMLSLLKAVLISDPFLMLKLSCMHVLPLALLALLALLAWLVLLAAFIILHVGVLYYATYP